MCIALYILAELIRQATKYKEENDLIIYFFKTSEPGIFTEPDSCGVYFFIRCLVRGFEFEDLI